MSKKRESEKKSTSRKKTKVVKTCEKDGCSAIPMLEKDTFCFPHRFTHIETVELVSDFVGTNLIKEYNDLHSRKYYFPASSGSYDSFIGEGCHSTLETKEFENDEEYEQAG